MAQSGVDFSKRRLCPDGACLGVLGDDGQCNECGRSGSGKAASPTAVAHDPEVDDAAAEAAGADEAEPPIAGDFDPSRRLCPDGACLGVIESNGRCNVCGCGSS